MIEYIDSDGVVFSREEYRAGLAKGRVRVVVSKFEPSIVDESKRDETDLNVLVKRWMRGEPVPEFKPAQFADVSEAGTFQEMQERLLVVNNAFATLPAIVREHFGNSAVAFADAMVDPSRVDELVELGLVKVEKPAEPKPPVEAAPATPAEAPPVGAGPGGAGGGDKPS